MSEEILKALTQLFALIVKQDDGIDSKERSYVENFFKSELDFALIGDYMKLFDEHLLGKRRRRSTQPKEGEKKEEREERPRRTPKKNTDTRVNESVRVLGICKKVNKTLSRKQKIVVLFRILELVAQGGKQYNLSKNKIEIVETVFSVFKFDSEEYESIRDFVFGLNTEEIKKGSLLFAQKTYEDKQDNIHHISLDIEGSIVFIFVESVEMYFVKYISGTEEINMNGFVMKANYTYTFSPGSTIKAPTGDALFFSDLARYFYEEYENVKLSFQVDNISYAFPNGNKGIRDISISEGPGKLMGIMGASGSGKTTLLNCIAGLSQPTEGGVSINGLDIYEQKKQVEGLIGYVSQDDLLIADLTVYENLYYNAKLCFGDLSNEEIDKRVIKTLKALGLEERKHLKVGSPLEKTISGGQRKRLNISLELIREPAVFFVDEPTSGLSSRDSENVIDLLKELSLKGKLIFVVIHQPSSDIYKMFDKMIILDTGGYQIYYGHPVGAITWFKTAANQVDGDKGNCKLCGNVNPEQIFNIVEAQVVDEYGQYSGKRRQTPQDWEKIYKEADLFEETEIVHEKPPITLKIPSKVKQWMVFVQRDVMTKLRNKQYLLINFLEAPVLALILAFLIRYKNTDDGTVYSYRFNDNIPAFFLMSVVVALFIGLSVSAEEIVKDRTILKREKFLNLSWGSYLFSKVFILFLMSAVQTFTFVLIGHGILEIKSQFFLTFIVLFSVSCFANILGLNISSVMKSAVNVYILIPLLLIPQMVLSGLLFNFSQLNEFISKKEVVPIVADLMASRWAYEAIAVGNFVDNPYKKPFFAYEVKEKESNFFSSYLSKEIKKDLDYLESHSKEVQTDLYQFAAKRVKNSFQAQLENVPFENQDLLNSLDNKKIIKKEDLSALTAYLNKCKDYHYSIYNAASSLKDKLRAKLKKDSVSGFDPNKYKNKYFNERLKELVRNLTTDTRIIKTDNRYYQNIESVFYFPEKPSFPLNYRTHFFSPVKWFFGKQISTPIFNIFVIWSMVLVLIITIYFKLLEKIKEIF